MAPLVPVIGGDVRRRTLLVVLAGLAVVVAAGVVVLWPRPPSRITRENYDRIRAGMTRAEIETILGPPGDYTTAPTEGVRVASRTFSAPGSESAYLQSCWLSDSAQAVVWFEYSGRANRGYYAPMRIKDETLWARFHWRLKRQWHRWFP
jgi:hypothetical protein